MTAETISFGDWVHRRRRRLDLTQEQLAALVGCSPSAIRKFEADERRPSLQIAELLATALQIAPAERATFLKVARQALAGDQLDTLTLPGSGVPLPDAASAAAGSSVAVRALPQPATPLVGRLHEIGRAAALLLGPDCRLLTLTGIGGIGKTRLALAAAAAVAPGFAHGVCFVPLAAVSTADGIWTAIAAALGLTPAANAQAQVCGRLRARQVLLVLDNLEHLLDGVAPLAQLVQAAPGVRILATSREPLGLAGEWVFAVHGLGLPAADSAGVALLPAVGDRVDALVLFEQAAQRADPDFVLRAADYPAAVRICRLVDGSPLGIELAAAWVRVLTCAELAAELERSLDLLATTARDAPPRLRSLRAAFEHSWNLLSGDERRVLAALAVFAGGFTRAAAEAVAETTLPGLSALAAKALVARAEDGRYDLHPLVRQYAVEKLARSGESERVHRRHRQYFAHLAQAADAARNSPQFMELTEALDCEHANLLAALDGLAGCDLVEAYRLAGSLETHWNRHLTQEAWQWLERLVRRGEQADPPVPPGLQARVLLILATPLDFESPQLPLAARVLALAREGDEPRAAACALMLLGDSGFQDGDLTTADARYDEAQRIAAEAGDQATLADVLTQRSHHERHQGHFARASALSSAAVAAAQAVGRADLTASAEYALAVVLFYQGDIRQTAAIAASTLSTWSALHDPFGLSRSQLLLADALILLGDYAGAAAMIDTADQVLRETGFDEVEKIVLARLGDPALAQGQFALAQRHYERALAIAAAHGSPDPFTPIMCKPGLALCLLHQGELAAARTVIEEGKRACAAMQEPWWGVQFEIAAALEALLRGDLAAAAARYRAILNEGLRLGIKRFGAQGLEGLAQVEARRGGMAAAARLLGAARELRKQLGTPLPPAEQPGVDAALAALSRELDPAVRAAEWALGEAAAQAGAEQAIRLALQAEPV